jgi:hypothetical protein
MWVVIKHVEILDNGQVLIESKKRKFKTRIGAILYLRLGTYWDADEEFGMMSKSDKDFSINYTLRYEHRDGIVHQIKDSNLESSDQLSRVHIESVFGETFEGLDSDK